MEPQARHEEKAWPPPYRRRRRERTCALRDLGFRLSEAYACGFNCNLHMRFFFLYTFFLTIA
ncbi:MAG TPA: hypothetical protein DCE42_16220 [Myxococcales bacterium]|nr:hypothetical protein [Deltaproteobacteria bacterium]HAA56311.1 hypothetical protein [Myxococcales bacterium]